MTASTAKTIKTAEKEEMAMLTELITNMQASTPQGFLGVGLIVFYFLLIVGTAVFRIFKADHMDH